jgi:hypothetical protein
LEDNISERGTPSKLLSDRGQVEISGRALELLRVLSVPQWQSEPHHQWQNYAEWCIQFIKQVSNTIMDCTGAPPEMWLLCLMHVAFLLNHMWSDSVKNVPLTALTGILLTSVFFFSSLSGKTFITRLLNLVSLLAAPRKLVMLWVFQNMWAMLFATRSTIPDQEGSTPFSLNAHSA